MQGGGAAQGTTVTDAAQDAAEIDAPAAAGDGAAVIEEADGAAIDGKALRTQHLPRVVDGADGTLVVDGPGGGTDQTAVGDLAD